MHQLHADDDSYSHDDRPADTGERRRMSDYTGPLNCQEHSKQMEQVGEFRSQLMLNSQKLNWVIVIASACLGAFALLWFRVGTIGEIIAATAVSNQHIVEKMAEYGTEIHTLKADMRKVESRLDLWNDKEAISSGTEKHHAKTP